MNTVPKQKILDAAVLLAARGRYDRITRGHVAAEAGCAAGSINYYFTDMDGLREAVMAHAVATGNSAILAQGLVDQHPVAKTATGEAKLAALSSLQ